MHACTHKHRHRHIYKEAEMGEFKRMNESFYFKVNFLEWDKFILTWSIAESSVGILCSIGIRKYLEETKQKIFFGSWSQRFQVTMAGRILHGIAGQHDAPTAGVFRERAYDVVLLSFSVTPPGTLVMIWHHTYSNQVFLEVVNPLWTHAHRYPEACFTNHLYTQFNQVT